MERYIISGTIANFLSKRASLLVCVLVQPVTASFLVTRLSDSDTLGSGYWFDFRLRCTEPYHRIA